MIKCSPLFIAVSMLWLAPLGCKSTSSNSKQEMREGSAVTQGNRAIFKSDGQSVTQSLCQDVNDSQNCTTTVAIPETLLLSMLEKEIVGLLRRMEDAEVLVDLKPRRRNRRLAEAGKTNENSDAITEPDDTYRQSSLGSEKSLLQNERSQLKSLKLRLQDGIEFNLPWSNDQTNTQPFAIRLHDAFARKRAHFLSNDNLRWMFASNLDPFIGSESRCQELFPGSRLPTTNEVKVAMLSGLEKSDFAASVIAKDPSQPPLFWTSSLPDAKVLDTVRQRAGDINQWVWAESINRRFGIQGRLMRMERTASLLCVAVND